MEERVIVLDRVPQRHPEVSKEDAAAAWNHCLACAPALGCGPDRHIAIGIDDKGRQLELLVIRKGAGLWLVAHAQCPPQRGIRAGFGSGRGM